MQKLEAGAFRFMSVVEKGVKEVADTAMIIHDARLIRQA